MGMVDTVKEFVMSHPFATGVTVGGIAMGVAEAKYHTLSKLGRSYKEWTERGKEKIEEVGQKVKERVDQEIVAPEIKGLDEEKLISLATLYNDLQSGELVVITKDELNDNTSDKERMSELKNIIEELVNNSTKKILNETEDIKKELPRLIRVAEIVEAEHQIPPVEVYERKEVPSNQGNSKRTK